MTIKITFIMSKDESCYITSNFSKERINEIKSLFTKRMVIEHIADKSTVLIDTSKFCNMMIEEIKDEKTK